ncbi:MAG: TfoX/Sxy family DNA transformation protein [Bacteroidetes bacterium]|nr:TfoX/Sxy family DNA transformation protein [Bacteroidota bacterium]
MNELSKLPNIGEVLAAKLLQAGINNEKELKACGSENALIKLATIANNDVCINMLYAIEGAIQGIRWHQLDTFCKQELKEFYHQLMK